MIVRNSQRIRPPRQEQKEASILAVRLKEAYERAKAQREAAES